MAIDYDAARQGIVTEIERAVTAWSAYTLKVEYENTDAIVLAEQVNPFLAVDIPWVDGEQLDLNPSPMLRVHGMIILAAGVKEGKGTAGLLTLLNHVVPYLQMRDNIAGGVRTHAARPNGVRRVNGFHYKLVIVNFWVDGVMPATP